MNNNNYYYHNHNFNFTPKQEKCLLLRTPCPLLVCHLTTFSLAKPMSSWW